MVVFQRNLVFSDEPEFHTDDNQKDATMETLHILENSALESLKNISFKSGWVLMSGQEVRYHSSIPFYKAVPPFSWALEIKDILTLIWSADEKEIRYIKHFDYTPERLRFWVLHTFLPLVLELERTYRILHVGSVEIAGKPVAFSAHSYGGKSTLTDYFLKQGHTLLSDDSLGIEKRDDGYYAISSYPFHRPFREMETLGYYTENFNTEPKPLHAVYVLEKAEPDADIQIVELKGIEKFKAFHYSNFIDFDFMKKERFEFFTEMAKHVPVYKIIVPWDMERLDEVYQVIVNAVNNQKI
jgi:hypothetical protein